MKTIINSQLFVTFTVLLILASCGNKEDILPKIYKYQNTDTVIFANTQQLLDSRVAIYKEDSTTRANNLKLQKDQELLNTSYEKAAEDAVKDAVKENKEKEILANTKDNEVTEVVGQITQLKHISFIPSQAVSVIPGKDPMVDFDHSTKQVTISFTATEDFRLLNITLITKQAIAEDPTCYVEQRSYEIDAIEGNEIDCPNIIPIKHSFNDLLASKEYAYVVDLGNGPHRIIFETTDTQNVVSEFEIYFNVEVPYRPTK